MTYLPTSLSIALKKQRGRNHGNEVMSKLSHKMAVVGKLMKSANFVNLRTSCKGGASLRRPDSVVEMEILSEYLPNQTPKKRPGESLVQ